MELQSWSLKFALALVVAAVLWASAASLASSLLHGRPRRPGESTRVAGYSGPNQASLTVQQGGMQ
jgi:hypothetical protein